MSVEPARSELANLSAKLGLRKYLHSLWRRRDFSFALSSTSARSSFESATLGPFWLLVNPLISSGIYFVVFGILFEARRSIDNFIAFLITGLLTFTFTSRGITMCTKVLRQNSALTQSVRFPRALLPISAVGTALVEHGPALGVIAVVALLTGEPLSIEWLLLAPAILLQFTFTLGLGLIAARLSFHYADIDQIVPHMLRLAMYVSGVMYTADFVTGRGPAWVDQAFLNSPFYVFMSLPRSILIEDFGPGRWAAALMWAICALSAGFWWFRQREASYANIY